MFIKNSICNYNAQELLLVASKLAFAIDAWVTLILIMELTKLLLLAQKQNAIKEISTHCVDLHDYISTYWTNNYDTIPHHFCLPFSQEPTIEHGPSYNSHSLDLL